MVLRPWTYHLAVCRRIFVDSIRNDFACQSERDGWMNLVEHWILACWTHYIWLFAALQRQKPLGGEIDGHFTSKIRWYNMPCPSWNVDYLTYHSTCFTIDLLKYGTHCGWMFMSMSTPSTYHRSPSRTTGRNESAGEKQTSIVHSSVHFTCDRTAVVYPSLSFRALCMPDYDIFAIWHMDSLSMATSYAHVNLVRSAQSAGQFQPNMRLNWCWSAYTSALAAHTTTGLENSRHFNTILTTLASYRKLFEIIQTIIWTTARPLALRIGKTPICCSRYSFHCYCYVHDCWHAMQ